MSLGKIRVEHFLESVEGEVCGELEADAKDRYYKSQYEWKEDPSSSDHLLISRSDGTGNTFKLRKTVDLDRSLVAFFGFYSGDGRKGREDKENLGLVTPKVSVSSQIEPNLAEFTIFHLRRLFPGSVKFSYTLGEDSAFFMAEEGEKALRNYYGGSIPEIPDLSDLNLDMNGKDWEYLEEDRSYQGDARNDLAFYYFHKEAMNEILASKKKEELAAIGMPVGPDLKIKGSVRRPYKKGAREPGGSSRSDELDPIGVNGAGELLLFIISEIEDSILRETQTSSKGLIKWKRKPSEIGEEVNVFDFFTKSPYGQIGKERPKKLHPYGPNQLKGRWKYSKNVLIKRKVKLDPIWCYTSGLYLAEGSTKKDILFNMFSEKPESGDFSLSFTSSEGKSLELVLRALNKLFRKEDCLHTWKLKVGSQYFPEMIVVGLKNGVPMLRGGNTGQGKLRTMEISLDLKEWALKVAPALKEYEHRYSHVEPTGAGVPRIDFQASSTLCRWYFPLLMYSIFSSTHTNPVDDFQNE